ncbi:MAG: penicillin-binding protein 1C [Elusimicrobia bacterium]|nr:penicillin-binding protein 1C [Elusimicrobiota bacterium]
MSRLIPAVLLSLALASSPAWPWEARSPEAQGVLLSPEGARPPTPLEVRRAFHSSEAVLLDRRGRVIQEVRADLSRRRLAWRSLGGVSPAVVASVLAAEDRRFYAHHGVDWRALAAAALRAMVFERPRGASTITMQVAGFLDRGLKPPSRRRSPAEKLRQMRQALALERSWSKDEILEAYLNLVAARGELQGISALCQGLFGKEPHGVVGSEAAVLAALLRDPSASFDEVLRRSRGVAARAGWRAPDQELSETARRALWGPRRIKPAADLAPLAARRLLPPGRQVPGGAIRPPLAGGGLAAVRSTLDAGLQSAALSILRERLSALAGRNATDGAVLVADNATGEVLAYVGNTGTASSALHVDGIMARRSAGSTLKPFLYALALDRRILTAASPLDDSPVDVLAGRGVFKPENYDRRFRGWVTVRQALAGSINVPAVRTLLLVGGEPFVGTLSSLGFEDLDQADFYGPSLALGSADVSLWELVGAYRALANGGLYGPLRMMLEDGPLEGGRPRRVFSREAAWLAADILSDRGSRSIAFGLQSPLDTRFWAAVKTGTSKDMRDNWCVGFSERYTVGVWVGNFSGAPMWNVSGVSGAAPAWQELMTLLHAGTPSRRPGAPAGLVQRPVVALGSSQSRQEWFLRGTEPDDQGVAVGRPRPKILSPVSGEIIALDPDIPAGHESVPFKASSGGGLRWRLDGLDLGQASETFAWRPERGSHRLELADASGKVLDQAGFTVRGESPVAADAREAGEDPVP